MRTALAGGLGALCAAFSVFFAYYTARLVYINVFGYIPPGHRQAGMYVGAVAFPIAAVGFGLVSRRCFRRVSAKGPTVPKA